ncbi:hypothetical protein ONA91_32700 [Micromonospora sp. DR5-3]|uniref:hypothetical protein n=1 Tax=unclassified Micromonospora TaxID=2617518 RepID=UPI0011DB9D14|nr:MULTISPECIES: hypothetical protein [unclassified Micromonospora]MCW3819212.1 hypothetical protein [Micromonospora sp. DR5-3]TYC20742.1 hypothetical protein FXF52_29725 [Micromonospora sp. MP36]
MVTPDVVMRLPRTLAAPPRMVLLRLLEDAASELEEALVLLTACGVPECAHLPIGVIDRLLLAAHRAVVGRDLEVVVECPACRTLNELPLGAADVPAYAPRWAWCGPGAGVREPTGADLLGLPDDPDAAASELLRRCTAGPTDAVDVPRTHAALDRAEQSLCGEVRVACIQCEQTVVHHVDVQQLVVAAVARAVAHVDIEVHLIASRYGWDLSTIEALPERRRVRLAALAAGAAR